MAGSEPLQHALRIRAAHVNNPAACLDRLWQWLDKNYGSPEVIEASILKRLESSPRISYKARQPTSACRHSPWGRSSKEWRLSIRSHLPWFSKRNKFNSGEASEWKLWMRGRVSSKTIPFAISAIVPQTIEPKSVRLPSAVQSATAIITSQLFMTVHLLG